MTVVYERSGTYEQENALYFPQLSPDGHYLVGQTHIVGQGTKIVAIDMNTGEKAVVAEFKYMIYDLRWVE
jgi:hypothetical protein